MAYLVTGGAGFIGSNIVHELVRRGERVRVLDNFSTGHRENLQPVLGDIELVEGDIRSYHIVREAVQGVEYVLHQAALPSVPRSIRDPITSDEVNVLGTLNVLQAARETRVRRLVFASSSSVYGNNPELPKREDMIPMPLSPYAISKLAAEQYCQVYWQLYGLETTCLRYFNVFGPRQDPMSQYSAVIPRFILAAMSGRPLLVHGRGLQSRDFTFVANVVQANLLATTSKGAAGKVMNIACGQRFTVLEMIDQIASISGRELDVRYEAARTGDVSHSLADISNAMEYIGYRPSVEFADGLTQTIAWFQAKESAR